MNFVSNMIEILHARTRKRFALFFVLAWLLVGWIASELMGGKTEPDLSAFAEAPQISLINDEIRYLTLGEIFKDSTKVTIKKRYEDVLKSNGVGFYDNASILKDDVDVNWSQLEGVLDPTANLRFYFGALHAHSGWSDGTLDPARAFQYGRDFAKLDFMAITEHPEYWIFEGNSKWDEIGRIAKSESRKDFLAVRGFEYSSPIYGHFAVLNTADYCSANRCSDLSSFYRWLVTHPMAIGIFAHPGFHTKYSAMKREFDRFEFFPPLMSQMVGIETIHWDGYKVFLEGFGKKYSFFDEARMSGWNVAPLGSQDNHGANWGTRNGNRVVVRANSLNEENLYTALRERSFYATNNTNLVMRFSMSARDRHRKIFELRWADAEVVPKDGAMELICDGRVVAKRQFNFDPSYLQKNRLKGRSFVGLIWKTEIDLVTNRAEGADEWEKNYCYARLFQGAEDTKDGFDFFTQSEPILLKAAHR